MMAKNSEIASKENRRIFKSKSFDYKLHPTTTSGVRPKVTQPSAAFALPFERLRLKQNHENVVKPAANCTTKIKTNASKMPYNEPKPVKATTQDSAGKIAEASSISEKVQSSVITSSKELTSVKDKDQEGPIETIESDSSLKNEYKKSNLDEKTSNNTKTPCQVSSTSTAKTKSSNE